MPRKAASWVNRGVSLAAATAMVFGVSVVAGGATSAGAASPSGTPLVIGVVSTDSGATGTTSDASTTVQDWSHYINTHGGINGHPVKVDYMDDGDSSATAVQDATQLITTDHVIALMDNSSTAAPYASLAAQNHVPMISMTGDHNATDYLTDSNAFAEGTTVPSELWAYAEAANLSGKKNLALLYCSNVAACAQLVPAVKGDAGTTGVKVVYSAGYDAAAPNFTAVCLAAKSANANSIEPVGPVVASNFRVLQNCRAQGYNPLPIMSGTNFGTQAYIKSNGVTNLWGWTNSLPYFVKSPATTTFDKVMASYLPKATSDQDVLDDWGGLQIFATAASKVPASAKATTTDIYTGLYAMHGSTLNGLTVPLDYTKGKPTPITCAFFLDYKNGKFGTPDGLKPKCQPAAASSS
jgi:branched-chain amino acid transport system substrate-binding protein